MSGLLADWRPCIAKITRELDIKWPTPPDKVAAGIDAFLDSNLKHQNAESSTEAHFMLNDWVVATYDAPPRSRQRAAIRCAPCQASIRSAAKWTGRKLCSPRSSPIGTRGSKR